VLNYSGAESVKFVASGPGDLGELKRHFDDDKIQYGKVICLVVDC
jgi:hypothetical protein